MAPHHLITPWLLFSQTLLLAVQTIAKVPAVIVFGDSSVDSGSNNQISTILKSNFKPYGRDFLGGKPTGRFSNGRIPSDLISEAFGVKPTVPAYLDPMYNITDFATGVDFASAGTGYDNATSNVLSVIPLWEELEYYKAYQVKLRRYLGERKANEILSEALFLMSVGTNDFLENYYVFPAGRSSQFTVDQYQRFLAGIAGKFITQLYGLGGRKISLGGLPPMGCMPLERSRNMYGNGCVEEYNKVGRDFNVKLHNLAVKLNKELPGIKVVVSNPYDPLMEVIQHPSSFGFESVAVACCGTGIFEAGYLCDQFNPFTCSDANKYVFWDSFHPTEKTNRIISGHLMNTSLAVFL